MFDRGRSVSLSSWALPVLGVGLLVYLFSVGPAKAGIDAEPQQSNGIPANYRVVLGAGGAVKAEPTANSLAQTNRSTHLNITVEVAETSAKTSSERPTRAEQAQPDQRLTEAPAKRAQNYLRKQKESLQNEAQEFLDKAVSDESLARAAEALERVLLLSDSQWNETFERTCPTCKDQPEGCTFNGQIYLRRSIWEHPNATDADRSRLLAREALHLILQLSPFASPSGAGIDEESFVRLFLASHRVR